MTIVTEDSELIENRRSPIPSSDSPPALLGHLRLPVVRGKKAISLERQVRIAAGLLVLLGAVLAGLVHPAFIGLSAFVGAGLVLAGITDTCGMGIMLAKMPWNRCSQAQTSGNVH